MKTILGSVVVGLLAALSALAACNTDGVTPNCPDGGGDCLTQPGDEFFDYSNVPSDAGAD